MKFRFGEILQDNCSFDGNFIPQIEITLKTPLAETFYAQ